MARPAVSYTMPFSNVSHLPLKEKLEATRLAGYPELSLMPVEVEGMLADGLGCRHASLNATFPAGSMSIREITDHHGAICRRARGHGTSCDLELIPLWGVPTLATAWEIVDGAGEPNGGLVFDVWHYVRGGSELDLLREIPGDEINCVQLNDGPLELPEGVTIEDDCYDRHFPGDGQFPNVELVRILAETGSLNGVGPEVFSPMPKPMSAETVACRSAESTRAALVGAGVLD